MNKCTGPKYMKNKLTVDENVKNPGILLLRHCLRMYRKILSNSFNTFGLKSWVFYFYLLKVPVKLGFVHFSLFVDKLFFPKYSEVNIEKPVFIIGHPRSATSFFHGLLTSSGDFLSFKNWEIYNPSIVGKKLFSSVRIFQLLSQFISDFRYTPYRIKKEIKKHREGLRGKIRNIRGKTEFIGSKEEEFLFSHILDTQFLAVDTPIGFSENGFPELCFADEQAHQERSVLFFRDLFKRQSYCTGKKQIMAKLNFSLFRLKALLKFFPDAKIIFIVRSPLETINSHLSAQLEGISSTYDLNKISDDKKKQFFKTRYNYNILFYKRLIEIIKGNEIPKDQLMVISYDSIKENLRGAVNQVKRFTKIEFSSELENKIREADKKQSSYKRKHFNLDLEAFDLTEDQIKSDFDFFFEFFGQGVSDKW